MINLYQPYTTGRLRPMIMAGIPAGHPAPVADEFTWVDLNELLSTNTDATIYGRVVGFSMIEANIYEGDLLVINTDVVPTNHDIVVIRINGETTCKFWEDVQKMGFRSRHLFLVPANGDYKAVKVSSRDEIEIIGVVDYTIHKTRRF